MGQACRGLKQGVGQGSIGHGLQLRGQDMAWGMARDRVVTLRGLGK